MKTDQVLPFIARLSRVTEALRHPIPIVDLAEVAGTSTRTVHRDMKYLIGLGAPIVLTLRPYRWRLKRPWSLWRAIEKSARTLAGDAPEE